jgi:hypothetical protein
MPYSLSQDASIPTHVRTICERKYVVVRDVEGNEIKEEEHTDDGGRYSTQHTNDRQFWRVQRAAD